MDDLISRQAAIDAIDETRWYHIKDGQLIKGANSKLHEPLFKAEDIYRVLEQLPSEQRWIPDGLVTCRDCVHWDRCDDPDYPKRGYCSHPKHYGERFGFYPDEDHFCGYAERRIDEEGE